MSRQFYNIYAPSDINDPKTKQYLVYLSQELNRALTYLTVSAGGIPPIPHARAHSLLSVADHTDVGTYLNQALLTTSTPTFAGLTIGSLGGILIGTAGVVSAITNNSSNWNTAYGWGNHASAGYLTTITGLSPSFTGLTISTFSTAGLLHNAADGSVSSSLLVDADITPSTITFASMQNLHTATEGKLLGRPNVADGVITEMNPAACKSLLGYVCDGDSPSFAALSVSTFTTAGVVHNAVTTGLFSSSLIVAADIDATITPVLAGLTFKSGTTTIGTIVKTPSENAIDIDLQVNGHLYWGASAYFASNGTVITCNALLNATVNGELRAATGSLATPVLFIDSRLNGETANRFTIDTAGLMSWLPGDGLGTNCYLQRSYSGGVTILSMNADILWFNGTSWADVQSISHAAITLSSLTGFTLTGQALSYTANYSLPLTADTAKGVTAYGYVDQNVKTASSPTFAGLNLTASSGAIFTLENTAGGNNPTYISMIAGSTGNANKHEWRFYSFATDHSGLPNYFTILNVNAGVHALLLDTNNKLWFTDNLDTNLYRGGANLLQTDDTFQAGGYKSSDGTAGATTGVAVAKVGGGTRTLNFKNGLYIDYTDS